MNVGDIPRGFARALDKSRDYAYCPGMPITGLSLRLERVAARVKLQDLAARMGVHRATLARYEGLAVVPDLFVARYRSSLETFREDAVAS